MNLDELQSVQSKERQATSLQNLRPSFYQEVGEFVEELTTERDRAAERADDPFSSPEVQRLTDDLQTARQTVEALYERRVGKVVKMASIAAADMPTDDDGLTEEEAALYDALVARIQDNRDHVLDEVLEGDCSDISAVREDSPSASIGTPTEESDSSTPDSPSDPEHSGEEPRDGTAEESVDAAAMMGAESVDETGRTGTPEPDADAPTPTEVPPGDPPVEPSDTSGAPGSDSPSDEDGSEPREVERTTVRITRDVGEIFGVDERTYELSSDEVVTLPAANADPLVERDAAEKLE